MAKKKVRIYKSPTGEGGYINKTAKFIQKAQMGMQSGMTPVTAGIMQQMQGASQNKSSQGSSEDFQNQIIQVIVTLAQQGSDENTITDYILTNAYGIKPNSREYKEAQPQILEFVTNITSKISESNEQPQEEVVEEEIMIPQTSETSMPEETEQGISEEDLMNQILYSDEEDDDYSYNQEEDESEEMRYGGIPNKRNYVKKIFNQLKKAQEGDEVTEANTATVKGTETNPTENAGIKNEFIAGVKDQSRNHFLKKQAEQIYNQRFGGRRTRRANRQIFGTPYTPANVTSANYNFGPLGGLRSADIQFNPFVSASNIFGGSYGNFGGGFTKKIVTPGRLVVEEISSNVNNESIKEVANATQSSAASNSVKKSTPKSNTEEFTYSPDLKEHQDAWERALDLFPKKKELETRDGINPHPQKNEYDYEDASKIPQEDIDKENKKRQEEEQKRMPKDIHLHVRGGRYTIPKSLIEMAQSSNINESNAAIEKIRKIYKAALKDKRSTQSVKDVIFKSWRENAAKYLKGNQKLAVQYGGLIMNPQMNEYGNLQKFIYGGGDYIDQADLDYTDSKDVTDAYFMHGGLHKAVEGEEFNIGSDKFKVTGNIQSNPTNQYQSPAFQRYNPNLSERGNRAAFDYLKSSGTLDQNAKYDNSKIYATGQYQGGFRPGDFFTADLNTKTFNPAGMGQPVWGYPQYGQRGYFGGRGRYQPYFNMYSPFTRGPRTFSPVGDPAEYAATAAAITKSGLLPTGVKFSKERKQDGNWFERNLGFNKDRIWTLNYGSPEQIATGSTGTSGASSNVSQQTGATEQRRGNKYKGMGLAGLRLNANDLIQRIKYGKPLEDDEPYTQQSTTPASNLKVENPYTPVSSMTRSQGADLVTGTPGTPVNIASTSALNTTPGAGPSMPTVGASTSTSAIQAQQRPAAANNITPQRTADIYNNPTTATKGNLTVINAAGEPINIDSPEYYDEEEMVTPQQNTPAVNNQPASVPQTEEPQSDQETPETEEEQIIEQSPVNSQTSVSQEGPVNEKTFESPVTNANMQPVQNYFQQPNSDLQRFTDSQFTSGSGVSNYGSFNQGDVFMQQPGSNPVADEDFYNSDFSPNPYDRSMMPFNPDYEQPTEYKFGVDPLTGSSSSDIAINNPNSILNTMEGRDWFAQQTPEVQREVIKNQTGTRTRTGTGARRNQQPTNNFAPRYNPASEKFDPVVAYYYHDIYNLKNRFNPKIDYSKNYSEAESRKLYDDALNSLYDDRNRQLAKALGKNFVQRIMSMTDKERRIFENISDTYGKKAREIERKNIFNAGRANGGLVRADNGINFSSVSYPANSIVKPGGIGQGKVGPCTEDEVKDPNSPCYDPMYAGQGPRTMEQLPTQAQLKLKENKSGTINYDNISRAMVDGMNLLADTKDYYDERRTKYIPGMTEFSRGERQKAYEGYNPGGYDPRTGRDVYQQGFEGVIGKKGGAIKNKKSKPTSGGNRINITDFQDLIKLAGLNKK
jgi:hypothetical protein